MKRCVFCLAAVLCLLFASTALANSWGAPGNTVSLFTETHDYDDYISLDNDYDRKEDTVRFVMHSRYHNQLICARKEDGRWQMEQVSTRAVYQPGENKAADKPRLRRTEDGFILGYGEESYRFRGELLVEARCHGLTFTWQGENSWLESGEYLVEDANASVLWEADGGITLESFSISLMPRTLEEIIAMKPLSGAVGKNLYPAAPAENDGSKQNVYSAPGDKSWRAAKGKAAVSLAEPEGLCYIGCVGGWDMIQYQVSLRTSRVGFIPCGHLGRHEDEFLQLVRDQLPAVTTADTWMTDDPGVSQFRQAEIPAGTALTMLGRWDPFYAWVETVVDGKPAWGFVPLRDLAPREAAAVAAADMPGRYDVWAGGSMIAHPITFYADGRFTVEEGGSGTWAVQDYDPEQGLFWNRPILSLTLVYDDGRTVIRGLTMDSRGFSLTDEEGGGGYVRLD